MKVEVKGSTQVEIMCLLSAFCFEFIPISFVSLFSLIIHLMRLHIVLSIFLMLCFSQVELGFGNGVVDDIFFVPGYSIGGFVVAQVMLVEVTNFKISLFFCHCYIIFYVKLIV